METKRYCVYNRTTESFLSVGTSVIDTSLEPLRALQMIADAESLTAESCFWLTPFKGIPVSRIFSPFDMVYLDTDYCVIQGVELFPGVDLVPFQAKAASALVLPLHTVYASRTYPGDQLIICAAEELVRHLARVPASNLAPPGKKSTGFIAEHRRENDDFDTPVPIDRPGEKLAEMPRLDEEMRVEPGDEDQELDDDESEALEKAPFNMKPLHWGGMDHIAERVPVSPPTVPTQRNNDSRVEPTSGGDGSPGSGGNDAPARDDRSDRKQIAIQRLNEHDELEFHRPEERERMEFQAEEIDSVISQVLRWAEETGRPLARAPISITSVPAAPTAGNIGRGNRDVAPVDPVDRPEQEATAQRPDERVESKVQKKASKKTGFLRWVEQLMSPVTGVRVSTAGAPATKSPISPTKESRETRRSAGELADAQDKRPRAAPEQLAEKRNARSRKRWIGSVKDRFMRWLDADRTEPPELGPTDRRRSRRHALPGLVAYYFTGGSPRAHKIGDISDTGFYLLTEERWIPETVMRMTLQRTGTKGDNPNDAITVISKVVRWGADGVGYEFVLSDAVEFTSEKVQNGKVPVKGPQKRFK
ncbi:MAG: hypothetical protein WAM85_22610 [Terracidiphilus sp.]